MKQLNGRVAVVTGAASGIGQLRWMRANEPLAPGPGAARAADSPGITANRESA